MATLSTSPISLLWVSWTDMDKLIDVETYGSPQITKWTKAQVKSQFASKDLSPMCCPHLRAPRIPEAIVEINNSRNNNAAMQYYMANNRFWLAHRMLLQAQFQSAKYWMASMDEEMRNMAGGLPDSKDLNVYFLTVDA
ncbi:hypothetical protein J4E89_004971 [Alternaria sp. Ai002NY15]|nr:hypothetical protein J4E89_004971 [Alternaria sp. Ai002NY15]